MKNNLNSYHSLVSRHSEAQPKNPRIPLVAARINCQPQMAIRGRVEWGEATRITGMPERSARNILADLIKAGLLASETPKTAVTLRFPTEALDILLPKLFLES